LHGAPDPVAMRHLRAPAALLAPALCWGCRGPARSGDALCAGCRRRLHRLSAGPVLLSGVRIWAPVGYSGPARDLVRALKFRRARGVADVMAAQIAAGASPEWLAGLTVVPVPLHPKRLRARGFNQAALIAEALARRTGLGWTDCLARTGAATVQVGRHRAERRAGPEGAIELNGSAPARVLLVDDVVTTGATLAACSRALTRAGTAETVAVTFARTLGR
jgi:ComF family protein